MNSSHLSLLATNLFSTDAMPAVMPNLNQYCLNMILRPFSATVVKPGKSLLEITALKAQEDSQQQVLLNAVHSKNSKQSIYKQHPETLQPSLGHECMKRTDQSNTGF